jgi:hypothetical protein
MNANKIGWIVALAVMMGSVHGLFPGMALASSASEIDRSAAQALTTLYKNTPDAKV